MKLLPFLGAFLLTFSVAAQEKMEVPEQDSIALSYEIVFLETLDKKKKPKDEYRINAYLVNKATESRYFNGNNSVATVNCTNCTSFISNISFNGDMTDYRLEPYGTVKVLTPGKNYTSSHKIRVRQGEKPVISANITPNFQELSSFELAFDTKEVNGRWKQKGRSDQAAFRLTLNGTDVVQVMPYGTITWKLKDSNSNRVYVREIKASGGNENKEMGYEATLTFKGPDRLIYTNNDGISVVWVKLKQ